MEETSSYFNQLSDALKIRADWLNKSELQKLKDELRNYHNGFASLYRIFLKKGFIHEDPYKQESKIVELEVPDSSPFSEAEKLDQLTRRFANYDNQLDFLVNFYQFNTEFITLDRIKCIFGLIKYIDWIHLGPNSKNHMTINVAEMIEIIKKGSDSLTMSIINEALGNLNKSYNPIVGHLRTLSEYQREVFKLDLREVTKDMPKADASNASQIKKKFHHLRHGLPFYSDLVDEVIKEDFSKQGPQLKELVLKKLTVEENKPKAVKVQVSYKNFLIEGMQTLGGIAVTLQTVMAKLDENHINLENRKKTFLKKFKNLMEQVLNKEPEPVFYLIEYTDPVKGTRVNEKLNFNNFCSDLERKARLLLAMRAKGPGTEKLEEMTEEQLIPFLDKNIREVQTIHKTLSALDDYFKSEMIEEKEKIKGIKPELGTIKNAIIKANAKSYEYSAQMEEEQQLRRLGVKPESEQ